MKELVQIEPIIERSRPAQIARRQKPIAQIILKKGMKIWEISTTEGTVKEVEYQFAETVNPSGDAPPKKLFQKPNCIYVAAINAQNALKKIGFKVDKKSLKKT